MSERIIFRSFDWFKVELNKKRWFVASDRSLHTNEVPFFEWLWMKTATWNIFTLGEYWENLKCFFIIWRGKIKRVVFLGVSPNEYWLKQCFKLLWIETLRKFSTIVMLLYVTWNSNSMTCLQTGQNICIKVRPQTLFWDFSVQCIYI